MTQVDFHTAFCTLAVAMSTISLYFIVQFFQKLQDRIDSLEDELEGVKDRIIEIENDSGEDTDPDTSDESDDPEEEEERDLTSYFVVRKDENGNIVEEFNVMQVDGFQHGLALMDLLKSKPSPKDEDNPEIPLKRKRTEAVCEQKDGLDQVCDLIASTAKAVEDTLIQCNTDNGNEDLIRTVFGSIRQHIGKIPEGNTSIDVKGIVSHLTALASPKSDLKGELEEMVKQES